MVRVALLAAAAMLPLTAVPAQEPLVTTPVPTTPIDHRRGGRFGLGLFLGRLGGLGFGTRLFLGAARFGFDGLGALTLLTAARFLIRLHPLLFGFA